MSEICIIIPCYNEGKRLPVQIFEDYIQANPIAFCFVDDGSSDNTIDVIEGLKKKFPSKVSVVKNNFNSGKAESVRNGVNYALESENFKYVGYFDADLATPLEEIVHIKEYLNSGSSFRFALGSRIQRLGSEIQRDAFRHYFGRVFATFASIVLQLPVYDTQCGAKIIEREIAKDIFDKPFISRWLFDVELIARVKAKYPVGVFIEVPLIQWKEIGETKIKLFDVLRFPIELIKIKKAYRIH